MEKKADIVFEVSWEVCNKVGGIYTVVKSKASKMVEAYGNNYFMIGPYFSSKALADFHEEMPIEFCKAPFEELKKVGIICHFGKWLSEGNPYVILIDFVNYEHKVNDIKRELWEWYKVDSLRAHHDYEEPVIWAYTVGMLIEKLSKCASDKKIVAHFHEWLSGAGLLYLKKKNVKVATVFTTHATILGRTLASSNVDLYNVWNKINPDQEVYKYNIEAKHLVEKNSAAFADMFTTVSEITGMEASYLMKKKPDVLLPNGLDISKFPSFEEIIIKHRIQRDRIREFMLYYFFPYYTFDPKDTLIYFLAGRYEFHDKGIDIYIKALGKLNEKMKQEKTKKTIIAFIWVPADIRNIKREILENKTLFQDVKDALEEVMGDVEKNVIHSFISGKKIANDTLFEDDFLTEMKIRVSRFVKKGKPPIATHDLYNENDEILKGLNAANLRNEENDSVKIIFYPIYLSGADGLLNLNYYEAMQGSHLGIFPSYYEPWGYTPLEAGALGVSSVTTDLAGFGRYFCAESMQSDTPGIYVLKRLGISEDDVVNQLVDVMFRFANFSKEDRIINKLQARKTASMADWKSFVKDYIIAHNMAIEKVYR
ncbi:glycogen/starch synthase, partial [Candidatus Woesearchaeota archaeon]|nr:glycogen/starch synthase [Candidatus Woesearchaeota archaeon]